MAITMTTSHVMTGRWIPIFGLNSLIFILSFGEFFILCLIVEMILPDIEVEKDQGHSDGFANSLQFVILICKYIRLALTNFDKYRIFDRNCTWLILQIWSDTLISQKSEKYA